MSPGLPLTFSLSSASISILERPTLADTMLPSATEPEIKIKKLTH